MKWQHTVFTRISAAFETNKVDKRRPRISAAVPMQRLFEEFRIIKQSLQSNSKTALEISFHQKRCSLVHSDYISPLAHWVLYPEFSQYP